MKTPYASKAQAESAADALNAKFLGAGYAVTYIGAVYAKACNVARGGFYVMNPWGKLV